MKSDFYNSWEWTELRYKVLKHYGRVCMCCGQTEGQVDVDHIQPRSTHPELGLEFTNCQVLCHPCNKGKSNKDSTDWRQPSRKPTINPDKLRHLIAQIG